MENTKNHRDLKVQSEALKEQICRENFVTSYLIFWNRIAISFTRELFQVELQRLEKTWFEPGNIPGYLGIN